MDLDTFYAAEAKSNPAQALMADLDIAGYYQLKSAGHGYQKYDGYRFIKGAINASGGVNSTTATRVRSVGSSCPQAQKGDYLFIEPEYSAIVAAYNTSTASAATFAGWIVEYGHRANGRIPIPDEFEGKYIMLAAAKTGHEDEDISEDTGIIGNYIHYYTKGE